MSTAYVPRPGSLPSSAASSPNPPPQRRQAYVPRSSSATPAAPASDDTRRQAEAILKLFSSLPAPLSDKLGTTLLPAPRPHTPSPPSASAYPSFKAFARAHKRKGAPNGDDRDDGPAIYGLGLGLSGTGSGTSTPMAASTSSNGQHPTPTRPPLKKARTASGSADIRDPPTAAAPAAATDMERSSSGLTPPMRASSHLPSPHRPPRSSLRNEIKRGTSDWTREQWNGLWNALGPRAHTLKRAGDAYMSPATAKGPLRGRVSEDHLRGVLLLTDSLCLYLYRNFTEERMNHGHVKTGPYRELEGLTKWVLGRWGALRGNAAISDEHKSMIKGMMGLIYLIDAIRQYHVSMADIRSLSRRTNQLSAASASSQAAQAAGGSSVSAHGPSPASSSASPGIAASRSPASSAPGSDLPPDVLKQLTDQVNAAASASASASQALLSSRHYLSFRTLRDQFPSTWALAANSDLAEDVALPPVGSQGAASAGDQLGCARALDIDDPDVFAWPIELGMQNAVAHVAVFGRALVREFAAAAGKPWEPVMADADSPGK